MYRVALWGIGKGYDLFTSLHGHEMVEVVAIADRRSAYYEKVDGIPVINPNELADIEIDYLIVTIIDECICEKVICEAIQIGIKREHILPVRIFQIPFFNFEEYIIIKNSNISILSDYCLGGWLYHTFGFQFTSPTINMYINNDNYYKFLQDIEGYMKKEMKEVENVVDNSYLGYYACPRGRLGDLEWIFNHDTTFETASQRWKRGVERFNYSNFIAVMTIRSDEMAYKFDELPIKNKIGFYWKDLQLKSIVCLNEWNNPELRKKARYDFAVMSNGTAYDSEIGVRAINWMKLLLHNDDFRRI